MTQEKNSVPQYPFGLARPTDPDTSHEAAASINVAHMEKMVLSIIRLRGEKGATWDEISDHLPGFPKASISPRFKPLREKGFIEGRGKRPGISGRNQTVWRLCNPD